MNLYIDLSEFFTNPITTGIQRISGELCKYAADGELIPVRLGSKGYIAFAPDLINTIGQHFRKGTQAGTEAIHRLSKADNGRDVALSKTDRVLVPEVFDNQRRLEFFRQMPAAQLSQFRFIVFDVLPMTHPQYFWAGTGIYEYFKLIRRATHCGFISEESRQDYYCRTKRIPASGGVVLPLGSDALGARPATPTLNRGLTFSVIGTVEPRKNHRLTLEAFEPLLLRVPGLQLNFVGRMGWVSPEFANRIHTLASDSRSGFRFFSAPGDDGLRKCIEDSRATVYLSAGEGYGLPPVESLWVGTPVIASNTSPSLKPLGPAAGVHLVDPPEVENVRSAVLAFLDTEYANKKTVEAFQCPLQTWERFAAATLKWTREAA